MGKFEHFMKKSCIQSDDLPNVLEESIIRIRKLNNSN